MKNISRKKFILATAMSLSVVFLLYFFINPASAHAEKIYEVLKGTTGPSKTIKDVWTAVITLVNYAGAAMLIFIAFANILRLDLNTYGIKKWLPSFIFAIIAANFSWIIIRAVVDLASVACDALINSPRGAGVDMAKNEFGIAKAFSFKLNGGQLVTGEGTLNWPGIGNALVLTLLELAGTVMVLILAFLFIVRQYFLYFIAAIGPLAFISAVLPFTKTVWNYWWQNLWKWAFMPVVSLFWLWLGSQWIEPMTSGDANFSIMSIVFAGVCFYMAITNPSKMGEGVMNAWKGVGKWGYKNTAGKGVDYMKAKGQATWNARKQEAQNWIKDKTGLGNGLDAAKQREADAMKRKELLSDVAKGKYIEKAGERRAFQQVRNMKMEGSADYANKEQLANLTKAGSRYNEQVKQLRMNSQKGQLQAGVFEAQWNELNNEMKENFLKQKDKNGNDVAKDSKEYKEREEFYEKYADSMWGAQVAQEKANKAANDPIKKLAFERKSIDEIANERATSKKMVEALEKLVNLQEGANAGNLTEEEQKTYDKSVSDLRTNGYDVDEEGNVSDEHKELIAQRSSKAERNFEEKVKMLNASGGSHVGIQDLLEMENGQIKGLVEFSGGGPKAGLERSRTGKYANMEVADGANGLIGRLSSKELVQIAMHGSEAEGISEQDAMRYASGDKGSLSGDTIRKLEEIYAGMNKNAGRQAQNAEVPIIFGGVLDALKKANNEAGLQEIARNMNEYAKTAGKGKEVDATASLDDLHKQISEVLAGSQDYKRQVMASVRASKSSGFATSRGY